MNTEMYRAIRNIVKEIDEKREKLNEEYKNTPQYKSSKKFRRVDQHYLDTLQTRRNTLVAVLNYDYTDNIKYLEKLINN